MHTLSITLGSQGEEREAMQLGREVVMR